MSWKLASPDHSVTLELNVANGSLSGTATFNAKTYGVSGGASGVAGKTASAFGLTGGSNEGRPSFVAATGIMTGSNDAPTQIEIQLDVSSSADGTINQYQGVLLPA
jgi:hypothetical protein